MGFHWLDMQKHFSLIGNAQRHSNNALCAFVGWEVTDLNFCFLWKRWVSYFHMECFEGGNKEQTPHILFSTLIFELLHCLFLLDCWPLGRCGGAQYSVKEMPNSNKPILMCSYRRKTSKWREFVSSCVGHCLLLMTQKTLG